MLLRVATLASDTSVMVFRARPCLACAILARFTIGIRPHRKKGLGRLRAYQRRNAQPPARCEYNRDFVHERAAAGSPMHGPWSLRRPTGGGYLFA